MALPGKGEGGGEGGVHAFLLGGPGRSGQPLGTKFYALKSKKDNKNKIPNKSGRKKN